MHILIAQFYFTTLTESIIGSLAATVIVTVVVSIYRALRLGETTRREPTSNPGSLWSVVLKLASITCFLGASAAAISALGLAGVLGYVMAYDGLDWHRLDAMYSERFMTVIKLVFFLVAWGMCTVPVVMFWIPLASGFLWGVGEELWHKSRNSA